MLSFESDPAKEIENIRKHGISFGAAQSVFADQFAIEEDDQVVEGEVRQRTIGMTAGVLVITVSHTNRGGERIGDEIARIISARKATRSERKRYEELRAESGWNPLD
jgi:uncharacterized DUF497 family protein